MQIGFNTEVEKVVGIEQLHNFDGIVKGKEIAGRVEDIHTTTDKNFVDINSAPNFQYCKDKFKVRVEVVDP